MKKLNKNEIAITFERMQGKKLKILINSVQSTNLFDIGFRLIRHF